MKPYTVILLRGPKFARYFGDAEPFGTDVYVALVEAAESALAIAPAIEEVLKDDRRAWRQSCREAGVKLTKADYITLVVLEGHANAVLWNWEMPRKLRNLPTA
jgi:hypothetical protein